MAGKGPPPKPSFLRQRTNKKVGAANIEAVPHANIPKIPNPDGRTWHELTLEAWKRAWESPMASQWLPSDRDGMGQLAVLWDDFYKGDTKLAAEIRLQRQSFGLTPLDRSRLQWEVSRAEDAGRKRKPEEKKRTGTNDPRAFLNK